MSQTPGPSLGGHGGWGTSGHLTGRQGAGLYQWGFLVGAGAIGLTAAGRIARPALSLASKAQLGTRVIAFVTRPINWGLYNAASEVGDIYDWSQGKEMGLQPEITARPWVLPAGYPIMVPFPWLDIKAVQSSSSGGGGPGGLPNLHQPPPSIEETGEILSIPTIVDEVLSSPRPSTSKKAGKRRKSCPPGYRWNGRRCVKKG